MWGYYANGFRGLAIEIEAVVGFEIDETIIRKVRYKKRPPEVDESKPDDTNLKNILTNKLIPWRRELEYRFLTKSENNYHKIGKITAVYFGNPYGGLLNTDTIQRESKKLVDYCKWRDSLILHNSQNDMDFFTVKIENYRVVRDQKI